MKSNRELMLLKFDYFSNYSETGNVLFCIEELIIKCIILYLNRQVSEVWL